MSIAVIIVAAGRGHRLGGEIPKQYLEVGQFSILRRSVDAMLAANNVTTVVSVIHPDDQDLYDKAMREITDTRVMAPVYGGATRAQSVLSGLEALAGNAPQYVLIHDAARPFVPTEVTNAVADALATSEGAVAALPIVDALWREAEGQAETHVERNGLWRAQTPQGFRFESILAAHRAHDGTAADDVAVAREAGMAVALVHGSEQNYKITTQNDLLRARREVEGGDFT